MLEGDIQWLIQGGAIVLCGMLIALVWKIIDKKRNGSSRNGYNEAVYERLTGQMTALVNVMTQVGTKLTTDMKEISVDLKEIADNLSMVSSKIEKACDTIAHLKEMDALFKMEMNNMSERIKEIKSDIKELNDIKGSLYAIDVKINEMYDSLDENMRRSM